MLPRAGGDPIASGRSGAVPFVALLLVLAIVSAVALLIQPVRAAPPQPAPPPQVALIGDSITDQARDAFVKVLAPRTLDVEATGGKKFAEQLGVAQQAADRKPTHVIINLGSNDVLLDEPLLVTRDALYRMVDLFPASCVHLVTVNETFFAFFAEGIVMQQRAKAINQEIRQLARERGYALIEWAQIIDDAIASTPPVVLTSDSVHPNEDGMRLLANAYLDSLAAGCS